jgi:hypothetical protein
MPLAYLEELVVRHSLAFARKEIIQSIRYN